MSAQRRGQLPDSDNRPQNTDPEVTAEILDLG